MDANQSRFGDLAARIRRSFFGGAPASLFRLAFPFVSIRVYSRFNWIVPVKEPLKNARIEQEVAEEAEDSNLIRLCYLCGLL